MRQQCASFSRGVPCPTGPRVGAGSLLKGHLLIQYAPHTVIVPQDALLHAVPRQRAEYADGVSEGINEAGSLARRVPGW